MLAVLTLSAWGGCDFFNEKPTPHFIDTDLDECREYEIVSENPFTVRYKTYHELKKCNGYICVPPSQVNVVNEGQSNESN